MSVETTILNFTGIYEQESFYLQDKSSHFVDLKEVAGTNCMCDDVAKELLLAKLGDAHGVHFIDNGNYHYVSALYLNQVKEPFSLVVLDHHPDMQRPMFDILSCGGWICHVLDTNEYVRDVHVIGADEKLISELLPEDRERVKFYGDLSELPETEFPVYLSIDKDVISRDELITNWDQGSATREQVLEFTKALLQRETQCGEECSGAGMACGLLGVDICGECAPDQEDCDLGAAVRGNDEFNSELLKLLT